MSNFISHGKEWPMLVNDGGMLDNFYENAILNKKNLEMNISRVSKLKQI